MENPEEFEIDDEGPEITEEEYQRSSILLNLSIKSSLTNALLQIPIYTAMSVGNWKKGEL